MRESIFVVAVITVLASMIVPLPANVVDFLLIGNLLLSLVLFISSFYVANPLKLSALPTILLLATLYKLALNISTTRLILGSFQTSQIIEAFGEVVIKGNLIIGAVIFLVITLVEFIVIAKGAERVAEVSARFTLDALPGKQMSIDADVRAGLIGFEEAKAKREELQLESRFYGALDGTMKFIKGDAIAGLCITAVNIAGGLAVGLLLNNLSFSEAVYRYTLLTVGDGLLSQIPALLNALTAGIVVTRVMGADESSLASDLISQLWQSDKARITAGIAAIALAFLIGLPAIPTFLASLLVIFIPAKAKEKDNQLNLVTQFEPTIQPLIEVIASQDLFRLLNVEFINQIEKTRSKIYESTGLLLLPPALTPLAIEEADKAGEDKDRSFTVFFKLRGVRLGEVVILQEHFSDKGNYAGEVICAKLEKLLLQHPTSLIDDSMTQRLIEVAKNYQPYLISTLIPSQISITRITRLLRELVKEEVNIRNMDLILQAIGENLPCESDLSLLSYIRIFLKDSICQPLLNKKGELEVLTVDPKIDLYISSNL